jgi:hypothetical protein
MYGLRLYTVSYSLIPDMPESTRRSEPIFAMPAALPFCEKTLAEAGASHITFTPVLLEGVHVRFSRAGGAIAACGWNGELLPLARFLSVLPLLRALKDADEPIPEAALPILSAFSPEWLAASRETVALCTTCDFWADVDMELDKHATLCPRCADEGRGRSPLYAAEKSVFLAATDAAGEDAVRARDAARGVLPMRGLRRVQKKSSAL